MKDHEIAARDLRAIVDGLGATMTASPDSSPLKPDDWAKKANAARVHCVISSPRLRDPLSVPYAAGIGVWLPAMLEAKGEAGARLRQARTSYDKRWEKTYAAEPIIEKARLAWKPGLFDVLASCLCDSDALQYDGDFEEWARDLGYESDSRSAEKTFRECERIGRAMKRLFGADFERARALAAGL